MKNESHFMRNLVYLFLIIFLAVGSFAVITVAMGVNATRQITEPFREFARQLVVQATPVIMPDPVIIVEQISDLARLETASYSMQKMMRADRNSDVLWGMFGESMVFVAYGDVIAGVDLQKLKSEDLVVVDPTTVMIHLPPAEIFIATLNNEASYVLDRRTGLFVSPAPQLETQLRQAAEVEILQDALEAGILDRADENAERYMRSFLQALGFENVIFMDSTPPPAPPFQQEVPKGYAVTPVP
jgi:hypothetical protein